MEVAVCMAVCMVTYDTDYIIHNIRNLEGMTPRGFKCSNIDWFDFLHNMLRMN